MVHTGTCPTMPSLSSRQPLRCSHALLSSLESSPISRSVCSAAHACALSLSGSQCDAKEKARPQQNIAARALIWFQAKSVVFLPLRRVTVWGPLEMNLNLAFCAMRREDADREDNHEALSENFAAGRESVGFELLKSFRGLVRRFHHLDIISNSLSPPPDRRLQWVSPLGTFQGLQELFLRQ